MAQETTESQGGKNAIMLAKKPNSKPANQRTDLLEN
jgi:hypothetical protein